MSADAVRCPYCTPDSAAQVPELVEQEHTVQRPLMWFRADLRIADNPALCHACSLGDGGVEAVFLAAVEQWRQHDWGSAKIDFIARNVQALAASLAARGMALHLLDVPRFADAPAALLALAQKLRCDGLVFNREYEVNEAARDEAVTRAFERHGLQVRAFDDQTIVPPAELRTGSGQFYRVFTPFKRAWIERVKQELPLNPLSLGERIGARGIKRDFPSQVVVALDSSALTPALSPGERGKRQWPAGEAEAQRRLQRFIAEKVGDYQRDRDYPALDGTSALSPYLAAGVISARQCLAAALDANRQQLDGGRKGVATWISELIWREFYRHVVVGFPRVCRHQPFRLETRAIRWRESESDYRAWCEGRTGVPIVDAAMRQLTQTGWMHNRLRMIAAMYFTKDLFLDWRLGERFFSQRLIDADLANNNGGWQWSASTGTDAAPYFRIFNPVSQSERFDPRGQFIRRWCPELASLSDDEIHDPSRLPPLRRASLDYPQPMVDHQAARQRVMEAFKALAHAKR
jgi:deoxyribodipyrimidine photo-lyase